MKFRIEHANEELAIKVYKSAFGCIRVKQGVYHVSIMNRDQAKSVAESLLMLVDEIDGKEV